MRWEGSGANQKRVLVPPTPERIKVIHDLAVAASGFKADRGDQLIVESLPFESTLNLDPPNSAPVPVAPKKLSPMEQLKSDPKMMAALAAIFAVVIAGVFFVVCKMMKNTPRNSVEVRMPQALPQGTPESGLQRTAGGNEAETWAAPQATAAAYRWVPAELKL